MGLCLACMEFFKHYEVLHKSWLFQRLLGQGALFLHKHSWLELSATPPQAGAPRGAAPTLPYGPTAWLRPSPQDLLLPACFGVSRRVSRQGHVAQLGDTR